MLNICNSWLILKNFSQNRSEHQNQKYYDIIEKDEMIMNDVIRTFSGREFTSEDIECIKWTRKAFAL